MGGDEGWHYTPDVKWKSLEWPLVPSGNLALNTITLFPAFTLILIEFNTFQPTWLRLGILKMMVKVRKTSWLALKLTLLLCNASKCPFPGFLAAHKTCWTHKPEVLSEI